MQIQPTLWYGRVYTLVEHRLDKAAEAEELAPKAWRKSSSSKFRLVVRFFI